jgi:hypothetical protein
MVMDIEIKIPIKKLLEANINSEEFCILVMLYKKEYELCNQYLNKFVYFRIPTLTGLIGKGYILSTLQDIKVVDIDRLLIDKVKCRALFGIDGGEENFYKFFATFPQKVPARAGGYRPLRPLDVDSQSAKKLKAKYFSKVGKKLEKQQRVQEILEAEIDMRRRTRALQYMNAMEAYLNGFKWEESAYLLQQKRKKEEQNGGHKRGEQLI